MTATELFTLLHPSTGSVNYSKTLTEAAMDLPPKAPHPHRHARAHLHDGPVCGVCGTPIAGLQYVE
jgi:hypothetical protein